MADHGTKLSLTQSFKEILGIFDKSHTVFGAKVKNF